MKNKNRRLPAIPPLSESAIARASQTRQAEIQSQSSPDYPEPLGLAWVNRVAWVMAICVIVLAARLLSFFIHHS